MEITITVEITAVEFRELNSFEWAVLTLLDKFQPNPPTIAEATAQLCIGEPKFLGSALETLRSLDAVRPKTDELRVLDLNGYDLSGPGRTILHDEGWETGDEDTRPQHITLDWPTMVFRASSGGRRGEQKPTAPSIDEVEEKLTPAIAEAWLNQDDNGRCWRVKRLYVTNVET